MGATQFIPYKKRLGTNSQETFWNIPAVDEIVEYVLDENGTPTDRKQNRKIQYVPGETSIYADEQSKDAKLGTITVHGNILLVGDNEVNKLEYLNKCNYNVNNPMRRRDVNPLFREYSMKKEYEKRIEAENLSLDAQFKAKEMDINEAKAYLLVVSDRPGRIDQINRMSVEAIRHELYAVARKNPKKFLEGINDVNNKNKLVVMEAIAGGYINYSEKANTLIWDSGAEILRAPQGLKVIDLFLEKARVEKEWNDVLDMIKDKMRTIDDKNNLVQVGEPLDIFAQTVVTAASKGILKKKGAIIEYDGEKYTSTKEFISAMKQDSMKIFNEILFKLEEPEEDKAPDSLD